MTVPSTELAMPSSTDQSSDATNADRPRLTPLLNWLFAFAACVMVTNGNWHQAILNQMATWFGVAESDIALIGTMNTVGYALGLLFITPLGDMYSPKRLILILCVIVTILSITLCFIPWLPVFITVEFFIGMAAVVPQIMVPVVADLAPPERRGKAVGLIVSSIMLGVLVSRVLSGLVAEYTEWRVIYYIGCALNFVATITLWFLLPDIPVQNEITYLELMKSLWKLLISEVVLQQVAVIGAFGFAGFTLFWTDLTFHLGAAPFEYNSFIIGLFGIIGIAGISSSPIGGHIGDVYGPYVVVILGYVLYAISFIILMIWSTKLAAIIVGAFLLDFAMQIAQVANGLRIFALLPTARSRGQAIQMVVFFLAGSVGTQAGAVVYQYNGWVTACGMGLGFILAALAIHLARTPLQKGFVPGWLRGGKWWVGVDVSEADFTGGVGKKEKVEMEKMRVDIETGAGKERADGSESSEGTLVVEAAIAERR